MKKEAVLVVAAVLSAVFLYTCSLPEDIVPPPNPGTLSVVPGIRGIKDIADFVFTVKLVNGPDPDQIQEGVKADQKADFTVTPGPWTISLEAYKDEVLKAEGKTSMKVGPGPNGIVRTSGFVNANLETLLDSLPPNTPSTPYTVKLNVSDLSGIKDILAKSGKYVNLDFSGSSFNFVPDRAFQFDENTTGITLPSVVTSIGDYAFASCTWLTSINIPAGITSLGDDAFEGCTSLAEITIPEGVESIGYYTFSNCWELKTVTFAPGSRLKTIDMAAFAACMSLTSITIPGSVTFIGYGAFADCESLTSVTFAAGSDIEDLATALFQRESTETAAML